MKQIRKRLTYANVMSSLAVFLILGGATALAATQLEKNSVGAKQLKPEAVTAAKLKNGAITPPKLSAAAQSSLKGDAGPQGPKGETGATGPADGPASGDLTGNFPGPAIAAGAVNGSKVADRSLSADDVTQASGQATMDFPSIAPATCSYFLVATGIPSLTGYLFFASPGNDISWSPSAIVAPYLSNVDGSLRIRVCNVGGAATDPPNTTFNWAVMKVA